MERLNALSLTTFPKQLFTFTKPASITSLSHINLTFFTTQLVTPPFYSLFIESFAAILSPLKVVGTPIRTLYSR